jgi:hypothetical protein
MDRVRIRLTPNGRGTFERHIFAHRLVRVPTVHPGFERLDRNGSTGATRNADATRTFDLLPQRHGRVVTFGHVEGEARLVKGQNCKGEKWGG